MFRNKNLYLIKFIQVKFKNHINNTKILKRIFQLISKLFKKMKFIDLNMVLL